MNAVANRRASDACDAHIDRWCEVCSNCFLVLEDIERLPWRHHPRCPEVIEELLNSNILQERRSTYVYVEIQVVDSRSRRNGESTERPQSLLPMLPPIKALFMTSLCQEEPIGSRTCVMLTVHVLACVLRQECVDPTNQDRTIIGRIGRCIGPSQHCQWAL